MNISAIHRLDHMASNKNESNTTNETSKITKTAINIVETLLLGVLVISFIACRFIPSLNQNLILQRYLQIYTAFFVTLECIIKFYNMYIDLAHPNSSEDKINTKSGIKGFFKCKNKIFWMKLVAFIVAFAVAVQGLVPLNLIQKNSNTNGTVTGSSLPSLLLATGMGIFPFSFSDLIFLDSSKIYENIELIFNVFYFLTLYFGGILYFLNVNVLGTVLILQLIIKTIELALKLLIKSKKSRIESTKATNQFIMICFFSFFVALGFFIIYYKKIELGFLETWTFFKEKIRSNF